MSNKTEPINWNATGWAFLGLLSLFAWLVSMVGQFIGVAWYFPWIFFGLFIFLVVKTSKVRKTEEKDGLTALRAVASPNEVRAMTLNSNWIQIPLYRDYEINCSTHEVRSRINLETIKPGHDPNGLNNLKYIELVDREGDVHYVRLNWIIDEALGKDHRCVK